MLSLLVVCVLKARVFFSPYHRRLAVDDVVCVSENIRVYEFSSLFLCHSMLLRHYGCTSNYMNTFISLSLLSLLRSRVNLIFLVWSVQSIIFIDFRRVLVPNPAIAIKKWTVIWKIYRVHGYGDRRWNRRKSRKVPAFAWTFWVIQRLYTHRLDNRH